MNYLKMNDIDTPVIHHIAFADESKDELVLTTGSQGQPSQKSTRH